MSVTKLRDQFLHSKKPYKDNILVVANVDPAKLKGKAADFIQINLHDVLGPLDCTLEDYVAAVPVIFGNHSLMRVLVDITDVIEDYGWETRRPPGSKFPDRKRFMQILYEGKFLEFISKLMVIEPDTTSIVEVNIPKWTRADGSEAFGRRQQGNNNKKQPKNGKTAIQPAINIVRDANTLVQSEMVYYFTFNILSHMLTSGELKGLPERMVKIGVVQCCTHSIKIHGKYRQFLWINSAAIYLIKELVHKSSTSHAAISALLSTSTGIDKLAVLATRDTLFCVFRNLCKDDMEEIEDRILYSQKEGFCSKVLKRPRNLRINRIGMVERFDVRRNWAIESAKLCMESLIFISSSWKSKFCKSLADNELVIEMIVGWLSQPCVSEFDFFMCRKAMKLTIQLATVSKDVNFVSKLWGEHKFKETLKQKMIGGDRSTLGTYLELTNELVRTGLANCRITVANDKDMMKWIMISASSFWKDIQVHAVNILYHLSEDADSAALLLEADLTIKYLCEQYDFFDMGEKVCCDLSRIYKNMEKHCTSSWKKQVSEAQSKGHDYNMPQAFKIKESANSYYKDGLYEKALELYIEAQKICPPTQADNYCRKSLHYKKLKKQHCCGCEENPDHKPSLVPKDAWYALPATLHSNRAQCLIKLLRFEEALHHCNYAILWTLTDDADALNLHIKSLTRRARAFYELQKYEQALDDIGALNKIDACNKAVKDLHDEIMYKCLKSDALRHLTKHCCGCLRGEAVRLMKCSGCGVHFCCMECLQPAWEQWHKKLCVKRIKSKTTKTVIQ